MSCQSDTPDTDAMAASLRERITAGEFSAGESRLPGAGELAAQYGHAKFVARHVMRRLEAEGLIVARERRGYFVVVPPPH
jgi:DNA-binding FadR family transcriptional regulator